MGDISPLIPLICSACTGLFVCLFVFVEKKTEGCSGCSFFFSPSSKVHNSTHHALL